MIKMIGYIMPPWLYFRRLSKILGRLFLFDINQKVLYLIEKYRKENDGKE